MFNKHATNERVLGLKKKALIDYFMTKVVSASDSGNLALADLSIKAIETSFNNMQFARVVAGEKLMIESNGSVTV